MGSAAPASEPPAAAASSGEAGPKTRDAGQIASEAEAAKRDFHRAAQAGPPSSAAARQRRSAALQTFFVANAGRSLLPAGETSGAVSPQLKPEEP